MAFSRNIFYSALGLLGPLLGAGGLYVLLSADFVAVTQLLVYIGGVLVLILFAVMLTSQITRGQRLQPQLRAWSAASCCSWPWRRCCSSVAILDPLARGRHRRRWPPPPPPSATRSSARWLLPFEIASVVLLATLVGAIVIARKEAEGRLRP